jgi:hypothetical protein
VGPFVSTFAECTRRHSAKVASLPSAEATALDKEALPVPRCALFAECYCLGTVTPRPIPRPAILTSGSSLGSYIVPTDQHESFVRTLSSLMRTRGNFPVGHPSQIAPSQARLTWRFFRDSLPKKKMHLVGMDSLLILLILGPGYHHPRGQDIIGTRQSTSLPSVTLGKVTSILLFYFVLLFHPNKQKISHNHHRYHIIITNITYTSHISQRP